MAGASALRLVAPPLPRLREVWKQKLQCDLTSDPYYRPLHSHRASAIITRCVLEEFSSPKRGLVGAERFKETASPGTYWGASVEAGEEVAVEFNRGSECVVVTAKAGENILRLAERCGVMIPNNDFCFEGSCCHCEMEVIGGAREVPEGKKMIKVNVIHEEDVWGEGVV